MKCTWKDCNNEAEVSQVGNDGREWANLCVDHNKEIDEAISSMKAKRLVRAWALASHGHKSREDLVKSVSSGVGAILDFAKKVKTNND